MAAGYEHILLRVMFRAFAVLAVIAFISGVKWRLWNPMKISIRLITELRHAVPPGGRKRLSKMTETFLAEVGVLLLVFPMLDRFISTGFLPPRYVIYSFVGAIGFYSAAALLAVYIGDEP